MTPVVLIGWSGAVLAALSKFLPEHSVVFVDEPDVLRKRNAHQLAADSTTLRELIEWEYLRQEAAYGADCFFHQHRALQPAAVVPISEYGVPFAARLAERFGVPGAGYGAALALRDKRLQRAVTTAAGILNPRSLPVDSPDELRAAIATLAGPVVLKPANRQAAVGTRLVTGPEQAEAAWRECLDQDEGPFLPDRRMPVPLRMLAEEYIQGDEYSVELMRDRGRAGFGAVTQKYLYPGLRPVEQGHLHPAELDQQLADRLVADTGRVLDAIGMDTGFVHCEWMVRDGTPYFIECAGRMAGDGIIELVEMAWDYDVVGEFYTLMQGRPLTTTPPAKPARYAAAWTSQAPETGQVAAVAGVEVAQAVPGVRTAAALPVGNRVTAQPRSSMDRVTLVTAQGDTAAGALANAQRAVELIQVTIQPAGRRTYDQS